MIKWSDFMIKKFFVIAICVAGVTGCANDNTLSGDVYSASQAKQIQTVTYGTLVTVRPVTIQGGDGSNVVGSIGGAVLGGFLGNTVGGGKGKNLATAAGAVAGGVAGNAAQSAMSRSNGVELEIRRDDGSIIMVVQKQGTTKYSEGQRVMIATSGSTVTVTPR
jgi:outer membrane lipoprotein SlyB